MSIQDYITQQLFPVFTFLIGIIPTYIALRQDKERLFLQFFDQQEVSYFLARSIHLAAHVTDKLFGRKLISLQSAAVSMLVSIVAFIFFFIVATVTTPNFDINIVLPFGTDAFLRALRTDCVARCDWEVRSDIMRTHYIILTSTFFMNLCVDYASVVVTRYLIRKLRYNDSIMRITCILAIDGVLDAAIFILGFALIYTISSYVRDELIGVRDIDTYTLQHAVSLTLSTVQYAMEVLWWHITTHFSGYFIGPWTISTYEGEKTVIAIVPLTTLMATSFATSVWIVVYSCVLCITRVFARSFLFVRKIIVSIYERPGRLVIWSGTVSMVYLLYPFLISW